MSGSKQALKQVLEQGPQSPSKCREAISGVRGARKLRTPQALNVPTPWVFGSPAVGVRDLLGMTFEPPPFPTKALGIRTVSFPYGSKQLGTRGPPLTSPQNLLSTLLEKVLRLSHAGAGNDIWTKGPRLILRAFSEALPAQKALRLNRSSTSLRRDEKSLSHLLPLLWCILLGCEDFNFLPTNGFSIQPLKVERLAGEQKATLVSAPRRAPNPGRRYASAPARGEATRKQWAGRLWCVLSP